MSLRISQPHPTNIQWSDWSDIVCDETNAYSARSVQAHNGHAYTVAKCKRQGKWWIIDVQELLPRHGPFDTAELAWSTLRLLA